jgi:predicted SAM-dependent methyltransferase
MFDGWINIDVLDLREYARSRGFSFIQCDVTKGLPFGNETVEKINCSHLLEHLTYEEGRQFLKECYRVLRKGGVIRISVPDVKKLAKMYIKGKIKELQTLNPELYNKSDVEIFWNVVTSGHKSAYDYNLLKKVLEEVGFKVTDSKKFNVVEVYPEIALVIYAVKER